MKLIPLSQTGRKNAGKYFAKVDDADYEWLNQWKWHAQKCDKGFIACGIVNGKLIKMHRLILGLTDPKIFGDHKDHDILNNQRNNLRVATNSQNRKNSEPYGTSKYLGVNWHITKRQYYSKTANKTKVYIRSSWRAAININGKSKHIGSFKIEEDAARAYDDVAKKYHGEFANLNFK